MKLHQDLPSTLNFIRGYEDDHIIVNEQRIESPVVISGQQLLVGWTSLPATECRQEHWQPLLALKPEILILGTGKQQGFLDPRHLEPFYQRGIGVELMNTGAACRTYNVLLSEDRDVVVAIWFG